MGVLPKALQNAVDAALLAVQPRECVRRVLSRAKDTLHIENDAYPLDSYKKILLLGLGKAAVPMVVATEEILFDRDYQTIVLTKYGHVGDLAPSRALTIFEGGHPVPDQAGLEATGQIALAAGEFTSEDLVLCLISGGCSSLMTLPVPGISLRDLSLTTELLLKAGADIVSLNTVRKHLSAIKGGGLARLIQPARIASLVLSDVIGDPLEVIGSGPTAPDSSTFKEARRVIERFDLDKELPNSVMARLRAGVLGEVEETPGPGDPLFERVTHYLCGNNARAAQAAAGALENEGFETDLDLVPFVGEARMVGRSLAALVQGCARPSCFVQGGETTVTVKGTGKGGRATELALAAAIELDGMADVNFVSFGTDGTDGPTDAAGALVTGATAPRARARGLDPERYLENNDSYHFFEQLGDLIITGPTQTNVADLVLVQVGHLGNPEDPNEE